MGVDKKGELNSPENSGDIPGTWKTEITLWKDKNKITIRRKQHFVGQVRVHANDLVKACL